MKRISKYWLGLLDLADSIIAHINQSNDVRQQISFDSEKKLKWLKTARTKINGLYPIVKRKKLTNAINYLNELDKVIIEIKNTGDVDDKWTKSSTDKDHFINTTEKLLESAPDCFQKIYLMGVCQFHKGNYKLAINYFTQILFSQLV